jgi:hypothetical protein
MSSRTRKIAERLLRAKRRPLTDREVNAQRISFAYGNANIDNDAVTRQLVESVSIVQEKAVTEMPTLYIMLNEKGFPLTAPHDSMINVAIDAVDQDLGLEVISTAEIKAITPVEAMEYLTTLLRAEAEKYYSTSDLETPIEREETR